MKKYVCCGAICYEEYIDNENNLDVANQNETEKLIKNKNSKKREPKLREDNKINVRAEKSSSMIYFKSIKEDSFDSTSEFCSKNDQKTKSHYTSSFTKHTKTESFNQRSKANKTIFSNLTKLTEKSNFLNESNFKKIKLYNSKDENTDLNKLYSNKISHKAKNSFYDENALYGKPSSKSPLVINQNKTKEIQNNESLGETTFIEKENNYGELTDDEEQNQSRIVNQRNSDEKPSKSKINNKINKIRGNSNLSKDQDTFHTELIRLPSNRDYKSGNKNLEFIEIQEKNDVGLDSNPKINKQSYQNKINEYPQSRLKQENKIYSPKMKFNENNKFSNLTENKNFILLEKSLIQKSNYGELLNPTKPQFKIKDTFSCDFCEEFYKKSILENIPLKIFKCMYCFNTINQASLVFYEKKYLNPVIDKCDKSNTLSLTKKLNNNPEGENLNLKFLKKDSNIESEKNHKMIHPRIQLSLDKNVNQLNQHNIDSDDGEENENLELIKSKNSEIQKDSFLIENEYDIKFNPEIDELLQEFRNKQNFEKKNKENFIQSDANYDKNSLMRNHANNKKSYSNNDKKTINHQSNDVSLELINRLSSGKRANLTTKEIKEVNKRLVQNLPDMNKLNEIELKKQEFLKRKENIKQFSYKVKEDALKKSK